MADLKIPEGAILAQEESPTRVGVARISPQEEAAGKETVDMRITYDPGDILVVADKVSAETPGRLNEIGNLVAQFVNAVSIMNSFKFVLEVMDGFGKLLKDRGFVPVDDPKAKESQYATDIARLRMDVYLMTTPIRNTLLEAQCVEAQRLRAELKALGVKRVNCEVCSHSGTGKIRENFIFDR